MTARTSRRGAPRRGDPSARERLIQTAIELFYQQGVRAIGIETVLVRSGVSKSSLYRTFASKEELIAAFAEEQNRRYWQWWDATIEKLPRLTACSRSRRSCAAWLTTSRAQSSGVARS